MPYIGSTPTTQNFISGTDYFNGTGAQTAFTLTRTVNSVNDIQVVVNNVVQQPNDAYTLSGTTLTFTSAPSSGTNNVYVRYLSTTLQSITPSYGSIIPSMLNPPNTIYWDTTQNVGIGTTTITSGAGWSPRLVLAGADTALIVKGSSGQESNFGTSGGLYIDCLGNSTATNNNIVFRNTNVNSNFTALERMRIDAAGNVGIGTNSPSSKLTVQGAIRHELASNTALYTTVNYDGISVKGAQDAYYLVDSGQNQTWYVGATERMRITSAGFLKASNNGTYYSSTGAHELRTNVNNDNIAYLTHNGNSSPYGPYVRFSAAAPNNASNYYFYCDDTSDVRFIVYSNGNVVNRNGSYGTISDAKNKENIVDATPKLDDVMQLKVRNFNFKTDPDLKQIGFVAQEFEEVFPAMVEDTAEMGDDGKPTGETTKAIKTTVLIPILVKAIQEQQEIIEELKARIETLEAK